MILGHIFGRVTTTAFSFLIEKTVSKFDYVQVYHKDDFYVLAQIVEIEKEEERTIGKCSIIGFKDEAGRVRGLRSPLEPHAEVLKAEDNFIADIISLDEQGAFLGHLEGKTIPVHLDLQKMLTKHVAILAKSGAGKSYTVGVLLEEIIEKKVPLLIIDAHGEYSTLRQKTTDNRLKKFGLTAKGYNRHIREYGNPDVVKSARPLLLSDEIKPKELIHLLPSKLSSSQEGLLYSALKKIDYFSFDNLKAMLELEEHNNKWHVISQIEHLQELGIFSKSSISYNEFIQPGVCSILNFKGMLPEVQEIVVYKLLTDLFEQRKAQAIPPFFCVIEEAHNYCPERSFGQSKSGQIIRTIASEGRKFGLGLAVVSQRPARVEKSVLSQITTQIILKVTNPNDLKTIGSSVEGLTSESLNEIANLPIGHALVTGVVDVPLFVEVRPRRSAHGGESVNMLDFEDVDVVAKVEEFAEEGAIPVIEPISKKDAQLMSSGDVEVELIPCALFICEGKQKFNLLVELVDGRVVTHVEEWITKALPKLDELSAKELQVLQRAFTLKKFDAASFIAKTKMSLDVVDVLESLKSKGYLHEQYVVSDDIILAQLSKYACHKDIVYKSFNAKPKDKKARLDTVKAHLGRFTTIQDMRECYVARYVEKGI